MVRIPTRLEEFLPAATLEKVREVLQQADIPSSVRDALHKVGLGDVKPLGQVQDVWNQARSWLQSLSDKARDTSHASRTINATGQLLWPDFERVPMNPAVALDFAAAATALHNDQLRLANCRQLAFERFERPAAWIHSSLVALQLLNKLAPAGIVVSRADAVRVPGFGDVRAMLTAFGHTLTETGAANGASQQDWEHAITQANQLLLLVSPNSLTRQAAAEQRAMAMKVAKRCGATVAELLIDGVANQQLADQYGFPHVQHRFSSGADLVLLPMHLLMAAPPMLLACGGDKWIQPLTAAAEILGAQCNGPLLAAAATALREAADAPTIDGLNAQLLANPQNLQNRAQRLAMQLHDSQEFSLAEAVERSCPLGGTPWDRYQLSNWAVRAKPRATLSGAAAQMQKDLLRPPQTQPPRTSLAVTSQDEVLIIDLRFVAPDDDHHIVLACLGQAVLDPHVVVGHAGGGGQPDQPTTES